VSSEEDANLLSALGVDYFQGFYFGEPTVSPDWLNAESTEPKSEVGNQKPELEGLS